MVTLAQINISVGILYSEGSKCMHVDGTYMNNLSKICWQTLKMDVLSSLSFFLSLSLSPTQIQTHKHNNANAL